MAVACRDHIGAVGAGGVAALVLSLLLLALFVLDDEPSVVVPVFAGAELRTTAIFERATPTEDGRIGKGRAPALRLRPMPPTLRFSTNLRGKHDNVFVLAELVVNGWLYQCRGHHSSPGT